MKNIKENLFNTIAKKMACSLGEASIKISENAMSKSCFCGVYETKIPIELLKNFNNK